MVRGLLYLYVKIIVSRSTIYEGPLRWSMKNWTSIFFVGTVVFVWIWSLPLLLIGAIMMFPFALFVLPISCLISLLVQQHCQVVTESFLRSFVNSLGLANWFPCNTISVTKQTVISVHPHGLLCCGALAGIHFVPGSTTIMCVAPVLFYIPVVGWGLHLLGCIPANYTSMLHTLQLGHSIIVLPGGVPEIVLLEQQDDQSLFPRYGFLKLAMATNTPVTTVFVRGECSTFQLIPLPCLKLRTYLSWWTNIPAILPIVIGHWGTWLPKQTQLTLLSYHTNTVPTRNQYKIRLISLMLQGRRPLSIKRVSNSLSKKKC